MTFSEKNVGFWLAYLLPTIVFCLCPIVLFIGRNRYARSAPTGSVLVTALRLWRFAARNRWSWNPIRCWRNMRASGFWDDAKPSRQNGEAMPKWMTFDDQVRQSDRDHHT
jgi:proton-dependent oligopeptide transporter, POT family